MSTNTVKADTTRTDQKSQLLDDPHFHNLNLHHELTSLLDITVFDNKWFSKVSKVLNIRKKELTDHILLNNNWEKRQYGPLHMTIDEKIIIWTRPDDGPKFSNNSNLDIKIKIIRFMLMAELIKTLKCLNKSSYEKVGITENWQRAKVRLNGAEIQGIVWADVLTRSVATDDNYQDEIQIRQGSIDISLEKENLSFF